MSKKKQNKIFMNETLNRNVLNTEPNEENDKNNFITFGDIGVDKTFKSPSKKRKESKKEKNKNSNQNNNNNSIIVLNHNINITNSPDIIKRIFPKINDNQDIINKNNYQQDSFFQKANNNINNINVKNNFYKKISPLKNNNIKPDNNLFENPKRHINKIIRRKRNIIQFQQNFNKTMQDFNIPKNLINANDIIITSEEKFKFPSKPSMNGLKNLKNTSYMNSVLQLFCNVECLSKYFLAQENPKKFETSDTALSFVIYRLFTHLYSMKKEVYTPDSVMEVLGRYNLTYKYDSYNKLYIEKNPNEFIIFLLDKLHNELNSKKNNENSLFNIFANYENNYFYKYNRNDVIRRGLDNFKENHNSIFTDYFTWFSIKTNTCITCEKKFYSFYNFFTFDLNIIEQVLNMKNLKNNEDIKISDCIEYYELSKRREKLFCNYCQKYGPVTTKANIFSSPNNFIFLLDLKDTKNIKFILEKEINLEKYIENKQSPGKYVLNGLVFFDKRKQKYNALCHSYIDNNWYLYDDENVTLNKNNVDRIIKDFNSKENKIYIPNILLYINKNNK